MRLPFRRKDKYDPDEPVIGIRRALIERGVAEVELDVTPELVANLYAHLSLLLYEAPNYVEATVTIKPAHERVPYIITVRRGDKPTPHDLRKEAEAEAERLRAAITEFLDFEDTHSEGPTVWDGYVDGPVCADEDCLLYWPCPVEELRRAAFGPEPVDNAVA